MAGRLSQVVVGIGRVLVEMGSSLRGVVPPMRSPDGTFGTQRMQSRARAAERNRRYPT